MSNLFGMLTTGTSGLYAAQAAISVTGHNLANVSTEGYSRQVVTLTSQVTTTYSFDGTYGYGVSVEQVARVYDEQIANSLRNEQSSYNYWNSMQNSMESLGIYLNELETGSGLGDAIQDYFDAWQDLASTAPDNSDEATIKRQVVVETASVLSNKMAEMDAYIEDLRSTNDEMLKEYTAEVNDIAKNIAYLNEQIAKIEVTGDKANDLRDQRDQLLSNLSELANVTVYERQNGQVAVFVANEAIVDEGHYNMLEVVENPENDGHYDIVWQSSEFQKQRVVITDQFSGGKINAEIKARDEMLAGYREELDLLARTIISETNRIHSTGQGLETFNQMTGTNGVINADYKLSEPAGALPYEITDGTFRINVYDSDGNVVDSFDIDVDAENDSLQSIAYKISAADGTATGGVLQATVQEGSFLKINVANGYTFGFAEDTSGILVAAGLNSFFTGSSAADMGLNSLIVDNPQYIATGSSGAPGDNTVALAIAQLKYEPVVDGVDVSIEEYYGYIAGRVASQKSEIDTYVASKELVVNELTLRKEEISGVSMDEELTNLTKYQRMYEANARFINVVDQMIDQIVNGLGTAGR